MGGTGAELKSGGANARAPLSGTRPACRSRLPLGLPSSRRRRARRSRACACAWAVPPSGARRPGAAAAGLAREFRTGVPGTLSSALAGDCETRARGRWVLAGIAAAFCLWASYRSSVSVCRRDAKVTAFHLDCKGRSRSQGGKGSYTHAYPTAPKLGSQSGTRPRCRISPETRKEKSRGWRPNSPSLAVEPLGSGSIAASSENSGNSAPFLHPC